MAVAVGRRQLPEGSIGEAFEIEMEVVISRVALYAGAFWESIWDGSATRVDALPTNRQKVSRLLDGLADHCGTCPPKARTYESYDLMVAESGLPADGSDECHSNCRCWIEFQDPDTGTFEPIFGGALI